jgi:hypothetical protein
MDRNRTKRVFISTAGQTALSRLWKVQGRRVEVLGLTAVPVLINATQ